jgi:hypothetical protein
VDLVLPTGWEDLGAKGLVVLFVLMIFLGWLIPKPWVSRLMADKDKQLASKDHQLDVKDETIDRLTRAVQDLTVTAHTGPIALRSIAREADKGGDE